MKVTGFSFIRDAEICDYPITEAVKSILPVCDDFVIAVGKSKDNTLDLVKNIDPQKVKILETVWDDKLREGGRAMALETDKAFQAIGADSDWCFYIQADEVVHENSLQRVYDSMKKWQHSKAVDGLLLDFLHFYGSYNYIADSPQKHRCETRVIRNNKHIFSYRDSMGFRKDNNQKLGVKHSGGVIYHYSFVKPPKQMMNKVKAFHSLWHDDEWLNQHVGDQQLFDYSEIDSLKKFDGTHPSVMQERISKADWNFEFDTTGNRMKLKYRIRRWIEKITGISVGEYKNYKLV